MSEVSSIRRKSDNTELNKREVVLVDDPLKSIRLTLWNVLAAEQGEQLASMTNPIVAIRSVRVGDYEGVSIGTVSRSDMVIDPDADTVPRAAELKKWWDRNRRLGNVYARRRRSRLRASGSKEGHHRHQPRRASTGRDRPGHR